MQADGLAVVCCALVPQSKAQAQQDRARVPFVGETMETHKKMLEHVTGETVFGSHKRKQSGFLSFAVPRYSKARPGHNTKGPARYFIEKASRIRQVKLCLDRTGASGLSFCQTHGDRDIFSLISDKLQQVGGQSLSKGPDI